MKRLASLMILLSFSLFSGCASERDLQTLRASTTSIERQSAQRGQELETRVRTLMTQVAMLEKAQEATRRDLAQAVTTSEEVRVELQRVRGTLQETRYQQQFSTPGGETMETLSARLEALERRLNGPEGGSAPSADTSSAALVPAPPSPAVEPRVATSTPPPGAPQVARVTPPPAPPPPAPPSRPPSPPAVAPPAAPPAAPMADSAAAERLYQRALRDYQQGNYEVAIVLFKQFLRQHGQSSLASNAQYWIGESLYSQKQYEAAIVAFDEVIQKYPKDDKIAASMLKQGFAFAELDDRRNARFFLQQVQKRYPQSTEAQLATEKLKQLRR